MTGWQSTAAFVAHVGENSDSEAGRLKGRVEHIVSYRATRFCSVQELLALIVRVLAENKDHHRT